MNVAYKVVKQEPEFKVGDTVHYYYRKGKFAKESSLTSTWSKTIQIHKIRGAYKFNPMHTYELAELGKSVPIEDLLHIQENLLKLRSHNEQKR